MPESLTAFTAEMKKALEDLVLLGTQEQADEADRLLRSINQAELEAALASFEQGTLAFIALTARLEGIVSGIRVNPAGELLNRFNNLLGVANGVLETVHDPVAMRSASESDADAAAKVENAPDTAAVLPPPPSPTPGALPTPLNSKRYEDLAGEYQLYYANCEIRAERLPLVEKLVARLKECRPRYEAVGGPLGIPWYFIGVIHALESSFNFGTHLHNGDSLKARTVRVPKGYPQTGGPPFKWEDSARDALTLKGFDNRTDWSVTRVLYRLEAYNGFGYRPHLVPTPYLWSFSNIYTAGKYVADHVFNPAAKSSQCGAAVMLRALEIA